MSSDGFFREAHYELVAVGHEKRNASFCLFFTYHLNQLLLIFTIFVSSVTFIFFLKVRSLRIIFDTATFHPKLSLVGVKTYEDLLFMPFGRVGSMFILINMFIFSYGSMVAYLLIVKDTVPVVLGLGSGFAAREIIMVLVAILIMLPLSLMRDMASLAFTSLLSVAADVILIVFVIIYSPVKESVSQAGGIRQVFAKYTINSHLFIGLGIVSQAMTCHPFALIIGNSLMDKTSGTWAKITRNALTIAWFLSSVMGAAGFLGFMDGTEGDILNNFENGSVAANASRGLVAITMIFTYPMQAFVARHVLAKLMFNGDIEGDLVDEHGNAVPAAKMCGLLGRRERVGLGIFIATLIPALIFNDLGPVLSITGAVGGSCLAYIGPGLVYLGCYGDDFIQYTNEMMGKKRTHSDPSIEIPVEGDANATMQQNFESGGGSKPWWWWVGLFPIWHAIASTGSTGMRMRMQQLEEEQPGSTTGSPTGEIIAHHNNRKFFLAIFLIAFGVLAVVAGVASNVYVQVNGIFSPPAE